MLALPSLLLLALFQRLARLQLSKCCFTPLAVLGAIAIGRAGHAEQQKQWLGPIAEGSLIVALAIDETGKHRPDRVATQANTEGDAFTISGEKTLVVDGPNAGLFVVSAMHDGKPALFAVEAADSGVTVNAVTSIDTRSMANVRFDNAKAQRLDANDNAFDDVEREEEDDDDVE